MAEGRMFDCVVRTAVDTNNKDKPTRWRELGVGWKNKDGSITLSLDAVPVNGKLVIFPYKPPEPKPEEKKLL